MNKIISRKYEIVGLLGGIIIFALLAFGNYGFVFLFFIPIIFFLIGKLYADKVRLQYTIFEQKKEISKISSLTSIIKLSENIGHEFNNPLTIILGQVYLFRVLNRPTHNDDVCYKRLLIIENEAKKLSNISGKFIALSQISSFFNHKKIDLNHLADKISKIKRDEMRKANIDYAINIQNGSAYVDVDAEGVLQICSMLFDNSIYFTKEVSRPHIGVNLIASKSALEVVVEDNGIGIDESIKDNIFNPLFTTKPNHEGVGLGLYIAQNIAKAMNGELSCMPKSGGAAFKISFLQ